MNKNHLIVLEFIQGNKPISKAEIRESSGIEVSYAITKRVISDLIKEYWIISFGKGKATT